MIFYLFFQLFKKWTVSHNKISISYDVFYIDYLEIYIYILI